ncbi:MAG: DUF2442 domain-containing protein [Anaerovibrio sp.]|uniref:DUF2442 domain-containing protein n=1 Tax=Anaerovibrio sp. TaxID=1872532 RepID=UPI0025CD9182|nr:DUF2442 domain-containing protein [Anaerovibrio sp.]MCR5176834.1 DUF2442 domain-containing protein [Anaerovibrio sp.]
MVKLIKVSPISDTVLEITYENGEVRLFDITPYLKGSWMGELGNPEYFKQVRIEQEFGDTVVWPNGQDIAPHELLELSSIA